MVDESLLRKKLCWHRINDVPGLGFKDLDELKQSLALRRHSLLVDRSVVNQLAPIFAGQAGNAVYFFFSAVFLAFPAAIAVLAYLIKSGVVLLGLLVYAIAFPLSSPLLSKRGIVTLMAFISAVGLAAAITAANNIAFIIFGSFLYAFIGVRSYYYINSRLIIRAALVSETNFLYLFERGVVAVRDNNNGDIHCWRESGSIDDFI